MISAYCIGNRSGADTWQRNGRCANHPVSLALGLRERFDVTEVDGKFGLYLDGHLLGTSKTHFDCDAAREVIVAALGEEYHY